MNKTEADKDILVFKKIFKKAWILAFIISLGIFLRFYNFHEWLPYRGDQPRDAQLVGLVLDGKSPLPLMGPNMNYTGSTEAQKFHLGPIYYYFQIISGYIFGNYPDKFAYPDLFFSVLSIPLFYFFLKRYFTQNLSLAIAGMYAISEYFIKLGRFAWNTNLIPFFVLLFLLSLGEFIEKKEKIAWLWVIALGISLGIGFQLHAILIVLFSIVSFFVFIWTFRENPIVWKKWAVVLVVILLLNCVQIYTEIRTNFTNTRIVLNFSSSNMKSKENEKFDQLVLVKNNFICHLEANAFFLTSIGNGDCNYDLFSSKLFDKIRTKKISNTFEDLSERLMQLGTIILPLFGYFLLFRNAKKESGKTQRDYLYLIILYASSFFLIMIPLSLGKLRDLRYFLPMFFLPFVLWGLAFKYISEKFNGERAKILIISAFIFIVGLNLVAIFKEVSALADDECSYRVVTLGKIEPLVDYISSKTNKNNKIFIVGEGNQGAMLISVSNLLRKRDIDARIIISGDILPEADRQGFFINCDSNLKTEKDYSFEKAGQFYVYQVDGAFVKNLIQ